METSHFDDFGDFAFDALVDDGSLMGASAQSVAQSFNGLDNIPITTYPQDGASVASTSAIQEGASSYNADISDRPEDDNRQTPSSFAVEENHESEDPKNRQDGAEGEKGKDGKDGKDDPTPAWSELKTKAGKERKRLPLACIACRRKKIRCSGEKPSCKHCVRSHVPCVYKVTTRKAAPRTDYMAMLDKRLKRMEERIIKVIPKAEQSSTSTVPRAVVKPAMPGSAGYPKAPRKRNADDAFGGLETWSSQVPEDAKHAADQKANAQKIKESEDDHLFLEGRDFLPSRDIQEELAEVFFDNVYGQAYNLLHKPSYMRKLKTNALPPVLVLSVCAVASRFSTNKRFQAIEKQFLRGEEWAKPARDICIRRYEWPNITILTCLIILGLHEFGTCQGGRSWALGGQAIRMAFALQLHKDLEYDPLGKSDQQPLSFIDREIRRRIMWACFLMDRFNSSATDRPMFIKEEDIRVRLPVSERCFQLDMAAVTDTLNAPSHEQRPDDVKDLRENMGVAAYMTRAVALWARVVTYLNQGGAEADPHPMTDDQSVFASLRKKAEEFESIMPETLRFTTDNLILHNTDNTAKQYLLLHIVIQQNLLFLNRAAAMSKDPEGLATEKYLSEASAQTFRAANQISSLLSAAQDSHNFVSAPFAGYCAFTATIVHVMGIKSGLSAANAQTDTCIETNIRYLNQMRNHWGMFYWMVEHLRTEYQQALDVAKSGKVVKDKAIVPILLYGDWFNEYPHGLADSDMMDTAASQKKEKGADGVLEPKSELQSAEQFFTSLSPKTEKMENSKGQAAAKRKQTARRQSTAARSTQVHTSSSTETNSQRVATQVSVQLQKQQQKQQLLQQQQQQQQQAQQQQHHQQQAQQRRYSAAQTGTPVGGNDMAFNPLTIATAQPGMFDGVSPITPVAMQQFPQQAANGRNTPFSPEVLMQQQPMHRFQQQNPLLQTMEQHMIPQGFANEQRAMIDMMGSEQLLGGMPMNGQTSGGMQQHQAIKPGQTPKHMGGQMPPGDSVRDIMGGFGPQDARWFMPFNLEPPMPTGEVPVGATDMDPFSDMFNSGNTNGHDNSGNGISTSNSLGGLRQGQ